MTTRNPTRLLWGSLTQSSRPGQSWCQECLLLFLLLEILAALAALDLRKAGRQGLLANSVDLLLETLHILLLHELLLTEGLEVCSRHSAAGLEN